MADTLPARRKGRRAKAPQPPAQRSGSGTVSERILEAVAGSKQGRRGLSLAALKKMLSGSGYDVAANKWRLKQAVRSLVSKGSLVQTSGSGASGSFKLSSKGQKEEATRAEEKPRVRPPGRQRGRKAAAKRPKRRVAPRKMGRGAKGSRKARSPKGRKAARSPGKGGRQRAKPRKLAQPPEEEGKAPAPEEISASEETSQTCSEIQGKN
ncbi:histone H1-like [Carcharodon carcharias]|uniref:histone H1-like n=1 Tax=Carcharodon carcharias TaxID=13397 RepID=UPI001B7E4A67|nr:histone H1-like [Carcharodon carcharias]